MPAIIPSALAAHLNNLLAFLFGFLADLNSVGSNNGVNLKNIILTVFILGVIGVIAWFVSTKPVPWWLQMCIYGVLGLAAIVIVYRFIQSM